MCSCMLLMMCICMCHEHEHVRMHVVHVQCMCVFDLLMCDRAPHNYRSICYNGSFTSRTTTCSPQMKYNSSLRINKSSASEIRSSLCGMNQKKDKSRPVLEETPRAIMRRGPHKTPSRASGPPQRLSSFLLCTQSCM